MFVGHRKSNDYCAIRSTSKVTWKQLPVAQVWYFSRSSPTLLSGSIGTSAIHYWALSVVLVVLRLENGILDNLGKAGFLAMTVPKAGSHNSKNIEYISWFGMTLASCSSDEEIRNKNRKRPKLKKTKIWKLKKNWCLWDSTFNDFRLVHMVWFWPLTSEHLLLKYIL